MKEKEMKPKFKNNEPVETYPQLDAYPSKVIQKIKNLPVKNKGDLISFYILLLDNRLSEHVSKLDINTAVEILDTSPGRIRSARKNLIEHGIIDNRSLYCSDKILRHFLIILEK